MSEKTLQASVEALREFVQSKGWSISAEKEIAHGYQLVVTDGANKTPINLFTTGKVLIQGKPSILQTELRSWVNERRATFISMFTLSDPAASQTTTPTASTSEGITEITNTAGSARIGSDESGKGSVWQ